VHGVLKKFCLDKAKKRNMNKWPFADGTESSINAVKPPSPSPMERGRG
jgi:hypothetical protein